MSTRTIVTSQPDVACELCARRLLRGESHEVFIADGRTRNVCELCAPRAADAGWIRERDGEGALSSGSPPRRGPRLFERLRSRAAERAQPARAGRGRTDATRRDQPGDGLAPAPADGAPAEWVERTPAAGELQPDAGAAPASGALGYGWGVGEASGEELTAAAEVFNESEFPRRIAALARSLGEPEVCLRPAEHLDSAVWITVAWELCWYRYEVDLGEQPPTLRALAQGTELAELPSEERHANASASPSGALSLGRVP